MAEEYTRNISRITGRDHWRAGTKGANLGEMLQAGFPVPGGFVVTTDAYNRYVSDNGIDEGISQGLARLNEQDPEQITTASREIRSLFEKATIPADVLADIHDAYGQMGEPPVAVRSSSTAEDLVDASFAGQYDTFLNVKGNDALERAVKKCWASFWNDNALVYRLKHDLSVDSFAQAVIVQRLINAEKAGVLFTANPMNSRRDQAVLSASWGLGEAIVNGLVTPDQWIMDRNSGLILSEEISQKQIMTQRTANGTESVTVPADRVTQATLNHREVLELLSFGLEVEQHFGGPQDIEWGYAGGQVYLLQSRPITALFPLPEPLPEDDRLHIYVNFLMSNQATHEPLTPLGEDLWRIALSSVLFSSRSREKCRGWIISAAGRLFIEVTDLGRIEKWWGRFLKNPSDMDPATTRTMFQVIKREEERLAGERKPLAVALAGLIGKLNPSLIKFVFASVPKVFCGLTCSPDQAVNRAYEYGNKRINALEQKAKSLETLEDRLTFLKNEAPAVLYYLPLSTLYFVVVSLNAMDQARTIVTRHLGNLTELQAIERAVPNNVTTDMGIDLLRAVQALGRGSEVPGPDQPDVQSFLEKHGHRSCQEIDVGVPRWREAPEYVIELMLGYLQQGNAGQAIEKFQRDMAAGEQAVDSIVKQLWEKGARRDARRVRKLLVRYRTMFGVREYPKVIMTRGVSILRRVALDIGESFETDERIDHRQDIFFVTIREMESGEQLQHLVDTRKQNYKDELTRSPVPRVITSTGEAVYAPWEEESGHACHGIPVSPGVFTGRARVLRDASEGRELRQGDILITQSTNPAWTPLFPKIGGLITETGGPMTHGSVVAREYGVPAVAGVRDATRRFQNGQMIQINGETGCIDVIDPQDCSTGCLPGDEKNGSL